LAGVVYRLPPARRERDALIDRLLKLKADQDVAILDNGDQLTGMVESLTEKTLVFRAAVGEVKIEVSRLMALALNPSLRKAAKEDGLRAWVGLTDGGRLLAGSLTLKDDELTATTLAGRLTTPARYLAAVQPLGGKAVYLSDLTPADYRHVPFLDLTWPWRADRAVTGAWPRAGGRLWLKGLGVHSTAKLSYALRDEYQRFEAFCAIDDSTAGGGSVRFRVYVDGREVFTSPIIRGRDKPVPVSVDVTGGKMLDLVVDFADRGDTLDHALWLEARIGK
jgi:hypothetical protein